MWIPIEPRKARAAENEKNKEEPDLSSANVREGGSSDDDDKANGRHAR
jgi:hypothetical protein